MVDRPIETLFIDFYGTIAGGDRAAVEALCADIVESFSLEWTPAALARRWGNHFFARIESANGHQFITLHEIQCESLKSMLEPIVGRVDPRPFIEQLTRYWRNPPIHDDAIELLGSLNLPVCCVSNADTDDLHHAIETHNLRFDAVVTSQDTKSYKPDQAIFHAALDTMAADPATTLHVGDSLYSDVRGAASLGIRPVWVKRADRIHDGATGNYNANISSLKELKIMLPGG